MRVQISNLRFETRIDGSKERKVRTPEGSEPANGGPPEQIQISDFKFEISDEEDLRRRQVQQKIDQPVQIRF